MQAPSEGTTLLFNELLYHLRFGTGENYALAAPQLNKVEVFKRGSKESERAQFARIVVPEIAKQTSHATGANYATEIAFGESLNTLNFAAIYHDALISAQDNYLLLAYLQALRSQALARQHSRQKNDIQHDQRAEHCRVVIGSTNLEYKPARQSNPKSKAGKGHHPQCLVPHKRNGIKLLFSHSYLSS